MSNMKLKDLITDTVSERDLKYLIPIFQSPMQEGHPFVPYTREEVIKQMERSTKIEKNAVNSFKYSRTFCMQDEFFGEFYKKLDVEVYYCNPEVYDWKEKPFPHEHSRNHLMISRFIDWMVDVYNLKIPIKDLNWRITYNKELFPDKYKITLKTGKVYYNSRLDWHYERNKESTLTLVHYTKKQWDLILKNKMKMIPSIEFSKIEKIEYDYN
jgi:hypothetical protein